MSIAITVFAKTRKTEEGRSFTSYNGRLTKKNGEVVSVGVKFKSPCEGPKKEDCPCNILFEKQDANLAQRYDEDTERVYNTLWIAKYILGPAYEDHSLDEF